VAEEAADVDAADIAPEPGDGEAADDDPDLGAARDAGALEEIEAELGEVDAALGRLDDRTYGSCDVCGGTLDDELLARNPLVRHCRDHLPLTLG
jgi:RNA polymerase-binding transcription factor DksA